MSKITEYLTIESKFRNRRKYENPFNFDIIVKDNNVFNKINASDPVSSISPIISWIPNELNIKGNVTYIINDTHIIIKVSSDSKFVSKLNYYRYCYINYTSKLSQNISIKNRIIKSKFSNKNIYGENLLELELEKTFSNDTEKLYLNALITLSNDTEPSNSMYYLPGDLLLENSEYYLTNDTYLNIDFVKINNYIRMLI